MLDVLTAHALALIICAIAYLMGAISSAISVCKLLGLQDPRHIGSGNPGTSNVLRNHGKVPAALTFVGDLAKAMIPVLIGMGLQLETYWLGWIGCCACIGHMYPIYYNFAGGKGVATAFGVIHLLYWPLALALDLIWLLLAKISGTASIASLTAWLLAPIGLYIWQPELCPSIACMSFFIWLRHKSNLVRLVKGKENALQPTQNPPPLNKSTGHQ